MADPGFVSGLIGAGVAKLLDFVIEEAKKAVFYKEYCGTLLQMLEPLRPVMEEIVKRNADLNQVVHPWLLSLQRLLEDSKLLVQMCNASPRNLYTKYKISHDILQAIKALERLQQQAPMINVFITCNVSDELSGLSSEVRRLAVALTTQNCIQSESCTTEQAVHQIRIKAVTGMDSTSGGSSSQESAHEEIQLQLLPEMIFGMEEMRARLEKVLVEPAGKWVGIWGKGGSGKTLLAQMANNSSLVERHFEGRVFWLTVARRPNLQRLYGILTERITKLPSKNFASNEDARTWLFNLLRGKKALLILDDVWEERQEVLELLNVVSEPGSKILVTSRHMDVLRRVGAAEFEVNVLSPDNSLKLFCVHAFPGEPPETALLGPRREDYATVVQDLAGECKGLPLALKVVGATLAGKQIPQFVSALGKLRNAVVISQEQEEQLYQRLKLSYDDMMTIYDGQALQQCFLYFAAFPEDASVDVDQLVEYLIGEGLLTYDDDKDPTSDAYYLLGMLISRAMVELDRGWSMSRGMKLLTCKVHDVLRDLAFYILQPPTSDLADFQCLFQAGRDLQELPQKWKLVDKRKVVRAEKLSLMSNRLQVVPKLRLKAPAMKVVLLGGNKELKEIKPGFLCNFPNLRVLDLSGTSLEVLPKDISRLRNLVVLDVSRSSLRSMPRFIGSLAKLEHLNMQNCGQLRVFPTDRLPKLTNLRYLNARGCANIWDSSVQRCCGARQRRTGELEHLSNLTVLTKLWISSTVQTSIPATLGKLVNLRQLSIYFQELKAIPEELKSLGFLQFLDLNSCFSLLQLPSWIPASFTALVTLDLRSCRSLSDLPPLDELKDLRKLDLGQCTQLLRLPSSFGRAGAFPALEEFWMTGCCKLEQFPVLEAGAFPRLALLNLYDCGLTSLDESLQVLTRLVHLTLGSCRRLEHLPSETAVSHWISLQKLVLKEIPVAQIPASIARLPCLKTLDLSKCKKLLDLPWSNEGSLFVSMEEAFFNESSVSLVPISIATAPKLKKVDLTDCNASVYAPELLAVLRTQSVQVLGWQDNR